MSYRTASTIARFLSAKLVGNPDVMIFGPAYLHTAKTGDIVYCELKSDEENIKTIKKSEASAVICSIKLMKKLEKNSIKPTLIFVESPKASFARVIKKFFATPKNFSRSLSYIGEKAKIGFNVTIYPNVTILDGVFIGDNVIIQSGAVLGAEGMDFGKDKTGKWEGIPHVSSLIIQNDVEIGPNTVIQRGMLRPTFIGRGTKIGPMCNIGHEVKIGKNCMITGCNMIAGATTIGDNVYIAPKCIIKNSINIGNNVFIGIGSLVFKDIPDNMTVTGRPAVDINLFRKNRKLLKKILKEKEELEKLEEDWF